MAVSADILADRRRQKRKLRFWRLVAVAAVAVAAVVAINAGNLWPGREQIARFDLSGLIVDDKKQREALRSIARADHVKALILSINSPGGTTTGAEALFAEIRDIAKKKPVVSVMGTVAASGGYAVALAGDHIVARGNTITGSIGVIVQWAKVGELLEKIGVRMEEVKSSPLKAEPSPFGATSQAALEATRSMVTDSYEWFVDLVAERRPFDREKALRLADGRVYTGRQAKSNGLVDTIGGEDAAVAWLATEKGIDAKLDIVDWTHSTLEDFDLGASILSGLARWAGLDGLARAVGVSEKALLAERVKLDGLVSVWHPE